MSHTNNNSGPDSGHSTPTFTEFMIRGLFTENPVFRLALSLCPAVAVTTSVQNGIILGIAVLAVQVLSSITASIFKAWINDKIRIPVYTIIIALWVSAIDMTLAAFYPEAYAQVGLYIKLIVAFAIIISRLELFAAKNPVWPSFLDGFSMGVGFMFALVLIGAFREVVGAGSILGYNLVSFKPFLLLVMPAGGFISLGLIMALFNWVEVLRGGKIPTSSGGH